MDRTTFRVGCDLKYEVSGPSAFIFNVGVVTNAFQRVVNEEFVTSPVYQVEESLSPLEEKRHHRFSSPAGPLRVSYQATVELMHRIQKGDNVPETVAAVIPSEVIPYLYPSRYCESDMLVRLAQHEFGKLQHGFSRVTAICNWIVPARKHQSTYLCVRYGDRACGRLSRFRTSRDSILPRAFDPSTICSRLCLRFAAAGFPRLLRSLSGRGLVYL